jgi:uncharacterized delta-60 repeat protein
MKYTTVHAGIVLAFLAGTGLAGDGDIDETFGEAGTQIVAFDLGLTNWDQANGLNLDSKGRIYLTGSVENFAGSGIGIARLTANGEIDGTFSPVFYRNPAHEGFFATDAAIQPDGKLVVVGTAAFTFINFDAAACRFHANGQIDLEFGDPVTPGCRLIDAGFSDSAAKVLIQPDGMIVLAGGTYDQNLNAPIPIAIRLDDSGTPDDAFGVAGVKVLEKLETSFSLVDIALAPNGDLVALAISNTNGDADFRVARLRGSDGELYPKFDEDGVLDIVISGGDDYPSALHVGGDGMITIAGDTYIDDLACPVVARFDEAGTADNSFDGDGVYIDETCGLFGSGSLHVQQDGKIVLFGGFAGSDGFGVMRLMPDGERDDSFGEQGLSTVVFPGAISYQAARITAQGNQLLLAGSVQSGGVGEFDFGIARLGTLDDGIFEHDFELSEP